MATLKPRFVPAIVDYEPYEDPEEPELPSFAPFSMMGTCEEHGLQKVIFEGVTPGSDPSTYFRFACGHIDIERF